MTAQNMTLDQCFLIFTWKAHLDGEVVEIHPHTWLGLRGQ